MRLHERPLRLQDAPAITALLRAAEQAEPTDEAYSEEDVVEEMSGQGIDLQRGSVAVLDGDDLIAYGALNVTPSDEAWRANLFGAVHPDRSRQGIGTRIVQLSIDQAVAWRAADRPDLPGEVRMWVPEQRVGTAILAAAQGFSTWRWFLRMRRELDEPLPAPAEVAGYAIRGYTDADCEATRLAYNASFADHWGSSPRDPARWREDVVGTSFRPEHSFLAVDDTAAVSGFVLVDEFIAETEAFGFRTGYVHLVGTVRSARGRGIASALLTRALISLAADGYRRSELGVDAASPTEAGRVYQRLGYRPVDRSQVFGRRF
jgi:mycothiol synthase